MHGRFQYGIIGTAVKNFETGFDMKAYVRKILVMIPAVPVIAFGVAFYLLAGQGADPFTSFQQGISMHVGVSVGTISLIMNLAILVLFLLFNRKLVGVGSVVFTFGIGPCIDLFGGLLGGLFPGEQPWYMIALFLGIGTVLIVLGLAYYLPIGAGIQPLDMVATVIGQLVKKTYGVGLTIFYLLLVLGTFILGAPIGVGTLIEAVFVGKLVDWCTPFMGKLSGRLAGNLPEKSV